MKKARKISCLLAIIMSVLIASCSNASGGSSTPPSVPNTPQQNQLQDQPQVKFTKLSIPKASVAYAGQTLTATLVGLNFPHKIYETLNEIDPTTGMYKQKLTEKSYKEITHFFSNIRITCESNPSIVTQPSPAYCDCGYRQSVFITISLNIPNNIGEYDITVSYGDESITSTLSVKDYSAYHAGDVLLNDGSTIPYDANSYSVKYENDSNGYTIREYTRYKAFSSDEKANAVGVLCGFNEYGAPIGWLGVYNSGYTDYQWRANEFNMLKHYDSGYEIILCEPDKWNFNGLNNYMSKFLGDTDGSDNWNYICSIDPMGTADTETNYPAFNFVNNYATTYGLSGEYAVGWYMPSIAELCYMYKNKDALDAVLFALGGNAFTPKDSYENMFGKTYFSSSICHDQRDLQVLDSRSGAVYMHYGFTSSHRVCCMLPFERTNQSGTEIVNDGSVSQITLNKTELTLDVGDTETLEATILPTSAIDKTVIWESSANDVATVSNGVVTAVSKGNAVITAKAGGKIASCAVTVNSTTYKISVYNGTANKSYAGEGTTVIIKAKPSPAGQYFDKWTTTTAGITFAKETAEQTTFIMPAKDVEITANYCEFKTVTLGSFEHGTVMANFTKAPAGTTIKLIATPENGYELQAITVKDTDGSSISTSGTGNIRTFILPAKNVTVLATFKAIDYTITVSSSGYGTATTSLSKATVGTMITITGTPSISYKLSSVIVKDSNGSYIQTNGSGNTRTFFMPANNVIVTASFAIDTVKSGAYHELPAGTTGTAGPYWTYATFGLWPQTIKASNVTVDEDVTETHGSFTYCKGSDGEWYVKTMEEMNYISGALYSDGTPVGKNGYAKSYIWFKVEPIKWRILTTDYAGNKLLLAENVLTSGIPYYLNTNRRTDNYGDKIEPNNYMYSTIRAYLNGSYESDDTQTKSYLGSGFYQTAFTSAERMIIKTTSVDNSVASTQDANGKLPALVTLDCETTYDKIFLLSEKEVTTSAYGFDEDYSASDSSKIRKVTDYAIATVGFHITAGAGCRWFLRSAHYSGGETGARGVTVSGISDYYAFGVTSPNEGIVPALYVSN